MPILTRRLDATKRAFVRFALVSCFSLGALWPVSAFKVDMHVYVAEEVIKDARDGKVSIDILDKDGNVLRTHRLPISARIQRVLRDHPEFYRMGSIGPDAFPSVEVGQMIIHPGIEKGWGTAEWLDHLVRSPNISDQEYAFALGNLAHAAGDIFAHTYVNRYAGDIFNLQKNRTVAFRHILIEAYLSRFLPRSFQAHNLLAQGGELAIPQKFIVDRMFFDKAALEQIDKSGYAPHIKHTADLRDKLDQLLRDGGAIDQLEQLAIRAALQITLDINVDNEQAKKIREYSEKIHNLGDFSEQGMQLVDGIETALGEFHTFSKEELSKIFDITHEFASRFFAAKSNLDARRRQVEELVIKIASLPDQVENRWFEDLCKRCSDWDLGCRSACQVHRWQEHVDSVINQEKVAAIALRDKLYREIADLEQSIPDTQKKAHDAILSAMNVVDEVIKQKLELNKLAMEFFKRNSAHSPMRLYIETWRADIDKSMMAYAEAHGRVIINTITPNLAESALDPFKDWFDCYMKAVIGIPVLITKGMCQIREGIDSIKQKIDEFEGNVAKITPLTDKLYQLKKELENRISDIQRDLIKEGTEEVLRDFSRIINIDLLHWKALFENKLLDDARVNAEFMSDESGVGLLRIGDIAERMQADMHVVNGEMDPKRFNALRNAITLAKLSLVDQAGLRELARAEGLRTTIFQDWLYSGNDRFSQNVLFGFARVIDGNDHWHIQSPPYPRTGGFDGPGFAEQRANPAIRYGYVNAGAGSCERIRGMRMWLDRGARKLLFERLFAGPLVPGVDTPQLMKSPSGAPFAEILQSPYPRTITAASPWGDDGIELPTSSGQAAVKKDLKGSGPAGVKVRISAFAETPLETVIDDYGHWTLTASVKPWRTEECVVVQHIDGNGRELFSYLQDYNNSLSSPPPEPRTPVPSFDCALRNGTLEQAICHDVLLADKDRAVSEVFNLLQTRLFRDRRLALRQEQQTWLGQLNACAGTAREGINACISKVYDLRLSDLKKYGIRPTFDCSAITPVPTSLVCHDIGLEAEDQLIVELYNRTHSNLDGLAKTRFEHEQLDWLKTRNNCSEPGMAGCVARLYEKRLHALEYGADLKRGQSIWKHNESMVALWSEGIKRQFYYVAPRDGLRSAAAESGTLLFDGENEEGRYSGTAYVFSKECGRLSYHVRGSASPDSRQVTLFGISPRVNRNCDIEYVDDVLVFDFEDTASRKD